MKRIRFNDDVIWLQKKEIKSNKRSDQIKEQQEKSLLLCNCVEQMNEWMNWTRTI